MVDETKKSTSTTTSAEDSNKSEEKVLDRDQHSPVSVSPEDKEKHSYTHNADKSDPIDPHLSDDNPPEKVSGSKDVEDDVLDRDKPGPVQVSPEDKEKPSYTHNVDKSDPIDPHLSDDNPPEKVSGSKNVEDDVLDRDNPGPVSVSPEDEEKPSYTHNAKDSDQSQHFGLRKGLP